MSTPDTFLSRWSRRKLEAEKPTKAELDLRETQAEPLASDPPVVQVMPALSEPVGEGPLSEEEIAALPSLEDLTAATDLAPFMRNGVPALLRNAALRRMWSLDPAIRDFIGEARDYSYDWNVPGGVPVSGPLLPGDDAEATLSRMFSRLSSDKPPNDDVAASPELETTAEPQLVEPAEQVLSLAPDEGGDEQAAIPATSKQETSVNPRHDPGQTGTLALAVRPEPSAARKRHGTALPKLDLF